MITHPCLPACLSWQVGTTMVLGYELLQRLRRRLLRDIKVSRLRRGHEKIGRHQGEPAPVSVDSVLWHTSFLERVATLCTCSLVLFFRCGSRVLSRHSPKGPCDALKRASVVAVKRQSFLSAARQLLQSIT